MDEFHENAHVAELANAVPRRPLDIFKTPADKYGRDIAKMSDFFDGYVQQMALSLREQSAPEPFSGLPVADISIICDVVNRADVVMCGNTTLLPDFDSLSADIKAKLKAKKYTVGQSKQVDGNLRAVILDENGVRVKDITLKKVLHTPGNIETVRSIANQMQMRQIYSKLSDIQELQAYQLERDRDRDIIVPFLDARSLVLEAETKASEEERRALLREADGKIRTALNAIYADIATTSKSLARSTGIPFVSPDNAINRYMRYLTSDLQIATKYVGVRMQLLEHMGEMETARSVLQLYQHVVYDFLTKPVTRKGLSTVELMQGHFPYDQSNMNCWYHFSREMTPALEAGIKNLELSMAVSSGNDIYVVSLEESADENRE